jgi:hypothetical protein
MDKRTKQFLSDLFREVSFINLSPRPPEFGTLPNGEDFARFGNKWSSECVEMYFPQGWVLPFPLSGERLYSLAELEYILKQALILALPCSIERAPDSEPARIEDISIAAPDAEHLTVRFIAGGGYQTSCIVDLPPTAPSGRRSEDNPTER